MSSTDIVAIVIAICTLLTAAVNHFEIVRVRRNVNGKIDVLLEVTARSARAEGVLHEQQHPAPPTVSRAAAPTGTPLREQDEVPPTDAA